MTYSWFTGGLTEPSPRIGTCVVTQGVQFRLEKGLSMVRPPVKN